MLAVSATGHEVPKVHICPIEFFACSAGRVASRMVPVVHPLQASGASALTELMRDIRWFAGTVRFCENERWSIRLRPSACHADYQASVSTAHAVAVGG
jgi:hypothetical protein